MMLLLLTSLACAFAAGWLTCLGAQDLRRARELAAYEAEEERKREAALAAYANARGYPVEYEDGRHDTTPWGERLRPGR